MIQKLATTIVIALVLLCVGLTFIPIQEEGVVTLEFLGAFHPLILHVPIGLWVGVLLLLVWKSLGKEGGDLLYWGGVFTVISGVGAFLTGLNLYWAGGYAKATLLPHMYGALAFLVGVAIFTVLSQSGKGVKALWVTSLLSMVALGGAGHVGGVITHGEPLDKAPWVVAAKKNAEAEQKAAEAEANDQSLKDPIIFPHVVMPILEEKCVTCHSSERAKGKLRMDSYAALIKGGSKGTSLVPGNAAQSLMLERVHLPLDNTEHMPPEDKPQLTPEETAFLEWWVDSGAKENERVMEASIPEQHSTLVNAFIGGDPEAIARRQQKEQAETLLAIHEKVAEEFPGIITQTMQGEAKFELNSASLYGVDEEKLRAALSPLIPHVARLDWHNKEMDADWFTLLKECKQLDVINLNQAKISDAQVEVLVKNNLPLKKLNLYGVPVTDEIISTLENTIRNGQVNSLILSETSISTEGRAKLRAAIPVTTIID